MKILLTGSRGFIGENIYGRFLKSHKIIQYDLIDGQDIRNRFALDRLFEIHNFDCVIHCAALTGVRRGERYPEDYLSTNVIGTKNIVDMCERYNVGHLISFSSSSVYGADTKEPINEEYPKNPKSIYGMTKLMAEQIVMRSTIPWCIVRPFTVYGDYGRGDQVIQKWINLAGAEKPITIYGSGESGRGYTYINDLLDGIELIAMKRITGTYNLGGNSLVLLHELISMFKKAFPDADFVQLPEQEGDAMYNFADTTRAKMDFGWEAKTDAKKKIKDILYAYKRK